MAVGASTARIDAADKLTGAAEYPGDRIPADALWAMAVFTDQPHARLVQASTSPAREPSSAWWRCSAQRTCPSTSSGSP